MSRLKEIQEEIIRLQAEIDEILKRPREPQLDGSVIAYRQRFARQGTWYHYSAIRSNGRWYTTGQKPSEAERLTWNQLWDGVTILGFQTVAESQYQVLREGLQIRNQLLVLPEPSGPYV